MLPVRLAHLDNDAVAAPIVRSFERHLRAENRRPATINHYLITLDKFLGFCHEENLPPLPNVTREHIEMWLESLHWTLKSHSVRSYYIDLRAFFVWMVEEDEVPRSPMARVKPPATDEARKDVVSQQDMAKVLDHLEREKRWRECAIIAVLYDVGCRVSELTECLTVNVNLETGVMFIPSETAKGRRVRSTHLSPKAIRYLDRYLRKPRTDPTYLFNGSTGRGKFTRSGIRKLVMRAFKDCGVEGTISPHDLRHTSASHVAEMGEMSESDAMTLYGWKSAGMWRRYTAQAREASALAAHKKSSPLERLPKPKK